MRFWRLDTSYYFSCSIIVFFTYVTAESGSDISQKLIAAPHKNVGSIVIDDTGREKVFDFGGTVNGMDEKREWE